MNATTFFTEEQFLQLQKAVANEEIISLSDAFGKKYRVNGNTYAISIHTGRYNFGGHEYFVSLWYDYNYPGLYQSRNIGGGSGGNVDLSSWEAFKACINETLCRWPDYKPEEEQPEQLSLFDM